MLKDLRRRVTGTTIVMWIIGFVILGIVIYGAVTTIRSAKYDPRTWVDLIIFGVAQGSVYALIALGYTMVYGILRMINFAHGEVFMAGSFAGYFVATGLEGVGILEGNFLLGQLIIFLVAMALSATIAVLLERIAYRPLRRAPRLVPLITAIGASFFLQYSFRGFFGSGVKGYPLPEQLKGTIDVLGFQVLKTQALVIISAIIMLIALSTFVQRTKTGRAHTSCHQAVAATGRLSSSDPNLQNIPIRSEQGRRMRRAFVPEPGQLMLAADYSQIELRNIAHLSGDERLLAAAPGLKCKAALSAAYGAGAGVLEVAALKVDEIDSKRMLIRVDLGTGRKSRDVMLSPTLLA